MTTESNRATMFGGDALTLPTTGVAGAVPAWQGLLRRVLNLWGVVALALGGLIVMTMPRPTSDPDLWWHLRNAQLMLQHRAFVRHDVLSFSVQGVPWIDHEWLSELPYYAAWHVLGAAGASLVGAALALLIFGTVLWLCSRQTGSMASAALATFAAALVSTISFGPRTLLFGWLMFCVQLVLLERFRHGHPRAVLLLPPLYLLWVNLHGSWLIGLGVLLVVGLAGHVRLQQPFLRGEPFSPQQSRAFALGVCGIAPALFCNPWGWRLVAYPFNFAFRQTLNVATLEEWRALDLHSVRGAVVAAAVLLLVVRQLWRPRVWTLEEVALFAASLFAACLHARFLFLFALLGAPIAARSFQRRDKAPSHDGGSLLVNGLLMMVVACCIAGHLRKQAAQPPPLADSLPTAALPALDRLPAGTRLFNDFNWGGYLEWNHPALPVFIDSRTDIFEYNGVLGDYLDIIRIKAPLQLLDRYHVDAVLFGQDTPLAYLLARSPGWQTAWSDAHTVLFRRATAPGTDPAAAVQSGARGPVTVPAELR